MSQQTLHPAVRLKLLRKSLQLSQRELATEFMVSSGAIAQWEIGSNPIPGSVLKLIEIFENTISRESNNQASLDIFQSLKKDLLSQGFNEEGLKEIEGSILTYVSDMSLENQFYARMKLAFIQRILKSLKNSKGLTIKFVQLLSYLELGLPLKIRMALGNLQGTLKPMATKQVREIVELAYGTKLEDIFVDFNNKPVAVTSLAQIHHARLKDGTEVAVKILTSDIKKTLEKQFTKIEKIAKIASYLGKDASSFINELKRAIYSECDYLQEAKTQEKIRMILADQPRTIVPKVHLNLSKSNILVTDYIHAENFHSFKIRASQDSKNIVAETLVRVLPLLAFSHGLIHGDIHAENFLIKNDKVVFLDFGRFYQFPESRMRLEVLFYQAILREDKEAAIKLARQIGFAKDEAQFDYDEFWIFLLNSQVHLLKDSKFKFTQEYVTRLAREGRRFNTRHKLKMSPESFWAFTFASGMWALFAELEACANWRQLALETFNQASRK